MPGIQQEALHVVAMLVHDPLDNVKVADFQASLWVLLLHDEVPHVLKNRQGRPGISHVAEASIG